MKKTKRRILSILLSLAMMLGMLSGMSLTAYADDTPCYTLDGAITGGSDQYAQDSDITQNDVSWKVRGNTTLNPWRIGGKNIEDEDRNVYSTGSINADITEVTLEIGSKSITLNSITLIVASDGDFTSVLEQQTITDVVEYSTLHFKPSSGSWSDAYYKFTFNVTVQGGSNKFVQFKSAKFYDATTVPVTGVTLDKTAAQEIDVDGSVAFTATVAPGDATDKTVVWSVGGTDAGAVKLYSNEACTTEVGADATETLTVYAKGISAGSATVTVTTNDGAKTASCDVTVNEAVSDDPYASLLNTTTVVKFNGYNWYIIADNSTAVDAGTVTLLSADTSFGDSKFHDSSSAYSGSTVKSNLDALTAEGGSFAGVKDAIVDTNLTDVSVTGAKLYLLNTIEANSVPENILKFSAEWWLRSPGEDGTFAAFVDGVYCYVRGDGGYVSLPFRVRPALQLDLSKVTFDSATNTFSVGSVSKDPVSYMAWDETEKKLVEKTGDDACKEYEVVTADTTAFEDGKWYVVNADVASSDRIVVNGEAHLILVDGKTLTAGEGIDVSEGNTLNIYGQSEGEGCGTLSAGTETNDVSLYAAIGGAADKAGGTITINGGNITAISHGRGAGIGGGSSDSNNAYAQGYAGGTITINGGKVQALQDRVTEAGGASIGGGAGGGMGPGGSSGIITINGGEVTAESKNRSAGIGSANRCGGSDGSITVNGGIVIAKGGPSNTGGGAGIGGGDQAPGCAVTITGGTVIAEGGSSKKGTRGGAGIGGGNGSAGSNVTITGGTVTATGGSGAKGIGGGAYSSDDGTLTVDNTHFVYSHTEEINESNKSSVDAVQGTGTAFTAMDLTRNRYMLVTTEAVTKYSLWVGGVQVTSANAADVLGEADGDGATVTYTPATTGETPTPATLTLNGASITTGCNPQGSSSVYGVYYSGSDALTIELGTDDKNTIEGLYGGIYSANNEVDLTIDGEGILEINASNIGINTEGNMIINDCTMSITATAKYGVGIGSNGNVTINSGSVDVTATAEDGRGIFAQGNVMLADCSVTAEGKWQGIMCVHDMTINGGIVNVSGEAGLSAYNDLLVEDSTVTAEGTDYGVIGVNSVTISGSTVTATSTSNNNGLGLYSEGIVTIDGGEFTAIGSDKAIDGTVKNSIAGTGWTNTAGTEGEMAIDASTTGQNLSSYKKVHFLAHDHSFSYTVSGATITATCTAEGCTTPATSATLTLVAPTLTIYGQTGTDISEEATLTGCSDFNTATGLNVQTSSIVYWNAKIQEGVYKTDGDQPLTAAPTSAGNYLAKITVNNCIASVGYTIAKAMTSITENPTASAIIYGQTLADSTLTGGTASKEGSFVWKDSTIAPAVSDSQTTEYDVVFTPTDGNYGTTECKVKLTVNKAEVTAPTIASKTYNGEAQTADVTASTLYSVTTNNGGTNVGSYDVVLTLTDSANYKWSDSTAAAKTLSFQITKATAPEVTVPTLTAVTYDPAKKLSDITLSDGWAWVTSTTVPTVGNSGYAAALAVDDANYDYTNVDGYDAQTHTVTKTISLTVNKAEVTAPIIASKTYTGAAQTADVRTTAARTSAAMMLY